MRQVTFLHADGRLETFENGDCAFGYRTSVFENMPGVIVSARLALQPGEAATIEAKMRELMEKRRASQPLELPSAGSTFKRPAGHFAGPLIQDAGLKGRGVGGAKVSEKHAGFVVNFDHATAAMSARQSHSCRKRYMKPLASGWSRRCGSGRRMVCNL